MLYGHFGFITILDELYVLLLMEEIRRSPPGTYKTMKVTGKSTYPLLQDFIHQQCHRSVVFIASFPSQLPQWTTVRNDWPQALLITKEFAPTHPRTRRPQRQNFSMWGTTSRIGNFIVQRQQSLKKALVLARSLSTIVTIGRDAPPTFKISISWYFLDGPQTCLTPFSFCKRFLHKTPGSLTAG